jgi:site-specific recombinase XerD
MGESYAPGVRQHLTGIELERPIATIERSQNEKRGRLVRGDRCLVLLMHRHGLRVSEACGLLLEQIEVGLFFLQHNKSQRGAFAEEVSFCGTKQ